MNDIEVLEELLKYKEWYKEHGGEDIGFREIQAIENLLKERQSDKEKIKKLEEELEEKDMQHELELIGKEEYTKASMGEIIEQYYTANEDCIPIALIKEKIEELNDMIIEIHRGNLQRYTVSEILSFIRFCEELLNTKM